jgi:hypothetical protein
MKQTGSKIHVALFCEENEGISAVHPRMNAQLGQYQIVGLFDEHEALKLCKYLTSKANDCARIAVWATRARFSSLCPPPAHLHSLLFVRFS